MTTRGVWTLIACVGIASNASAQDATTKVARKYESVEGKYKVSLPAKPELSTTELNAAGVKFKMHMATVEGEAATQCVIHIELPEIAVKPTTRRQMESARDRAVKDAAGQLVWDRVWYFGGNHEGRDFLIRTGEGDHMRIRVFVVGKRMYQLAYLGTKVGCESKATTAFFDSFELVR